MKDVKDVNPLNPIVVSWKNNNSNIENKKDIQKALIENNPDIRQIDVKDTLISLLAMEPEIEVNQFLTRYPEKQRGSVDIIIDNLKRDGDVFEHKPGFIKLL